MPEFGLIVIKNPGPNTELEMHGVAGWSDPAFSRFTQALKQKEAEEAKGNIAYTVVAFGEDEGDGLQVELGYDMELAYENGCLTDEETEAYEKENADE